jgi:hypothetical protein
VKSEQIGVRKHWTKEYRMRETNLRQSVWILALMLGAVIALGPIRLAASPLPQEQHEQDYSKNKNYEQGMRDGKDDQAHNRDHSKKRHFKKDEDQKAYESGYQQGHRGDDRDHPGDQHDR